MGPQRNDVTSRWVLVDTETGQQAGPPVRFIDLEDAETYRRFAYDGNPRYALTRIEVAVPIDPGEPRVW
jgi:hypothetical protein